MKERLNKPRVFLSHARRDVSFIERIESDLRRCQIDPWRDQNEIRDGRPYMSAIFEDGIPTCDAILAYFTDNSLGSEMVGREVDSAILRRLQDNGVAFLPYVDSEITRSKIRVDIQTLQCREWNEQNYDSILPSVVSEIWRSFLERHIKIAVLSERTRRLELELELQRLSQGGDSPFSGQEEREFRYIFDGLNRDELCEAMVFIRVNVEREPPVPHESRIYIFSVPMFKAVSSFSKKRRMFDLDYFGHFVFSDDRVDKSSFPLAEDESISTIRMHRSDVFNHLVKYGLIEREKRERSLGGEEDRYYFSPKMGRLLFWAEYNGLGEDDFLPTFKQEKD